MSATFSYPRGDLYYNHSDRFSLSGTIVGLIIGAITCIILGALSHWCIILLTPIL